MPILFKRFLALLFCSYLFYPSSVFANYFENFDLSATSGGIITIHENGGVVEVSNGLLHINRPVNPSNRMPFLYTSSSIFPNNGSFALEIRYRYTQVGNFGSAITISSDLVPQNGINPDSNLNSYMKFMIYQDQPNGLSFGKIICEINNNNCQTRTFLKPFTHMPDTTFHVFKLIYTKNSEYEIYLDSSLAPDFKSAPNQPRPKYLWMGNSMMTLSNDLWNSIDIDYIKVEGMETEKKPVVILPGFGGSWDVDAVLTGQSGTNWKIPAFVKEYDGIINSLKNAGYEENTNLFIFGYDWRKTLNSLADDLNNFLTSKGINDKDINLIGHSMGGLVARSYIQKYNNTKAKVITAGSPHMGIVDAYAMWEGMTVWDGVWWQKALHLIATELNRLPGEMKIDSARRNAPSIKDLMPTWSFLRKDNLAVPIENMKWKNDFLLGQNISVTTYFDQITSGFSTDYQTKSGLFVTKPTKEDALLGIWDDGRPVEKNQFLKSLGDGYVTSTSSANIFTKTTSLTGGHGETISKKENIIKILSEIGVATESAVGSLTDNRKKFLVFKLNSPGEISVCLANLCDDLLGLKFESQKMLIIPGFVDGEYKVSIKANGQTGKYELVVGKSGDENFEWKSEKGELKSTIQTDEYNFGSVVDILKPTKTTSQNNLLLYYPSGVDPKRINILRQEIFSKIDLAIKLADISSFDIEVSKWVALNDFMDSTDLSKVKWFGGRDWDERFFGLYKSKYLIPGRNYFSETLINLYKQINLEYRQTNKKDLLRLLDKKIQLIQLQYFLGKGYSSFF